MIEAKRKEISTLIVTGTFRVIPREETPEDGNIINGRYFLTIEPSKEDKVRYKSRRVTGGYRERFKKLIVH